MSQYTSRSFSGVVLLSGLILTGALTPQAWAKEQALSPTGDTEKASLMEAPFELGKVIPVPLRAGAGESADTIQLAWVVFNRQQDEVRADLRVVMKSWPKGKWQIDVKLLDREGKTLSTASAVVENRGDIYGVALVEEGDVEFALGPAADLPRGTRFRVRVEQAAADANVDAELVAPERPKRPKGPFSMEVTVRGGDTSPHDRGEFILWRLADEKERGGPAAGLSALRGGNGVRWHDPATGETWEPRHGVAYRSPRKEFTFKELPAGSYRVTAVNSSEGDPTPSAAGEPVRLDDENPTGKVTVQLKGDYPLAVTVVRADTGEPLPSTYVVLRRADGMPIVATSNSRGRFTDKGGTKCFGHLQPGPYSLHVGLHKDERRWQVYPRSTVMVVPVEVKAGERNEIVVEFDDSSHDERSGEQAPF